ncbi:MAG: ABC transporter permease [Firmicutes bacterium]|nr:ABC transporter permease [Bacillota bacterium]
MSSAQAFKTIADVLSSTIIFAVPLMLVALGAMFSERSGVVNIALEGIMVIGALFSCLFLSMSNTQGWGSVHPQLTMLLAILVAGGAGVIFSLFLAFASINLKADQIIGGTALNTFAPAFSIVLSWAIQGQGQTQIAIPTWIRISGLKIDSVNSLGNFLEWVFLKNLYLTTLLAVVILIVGIIVLRKTRFGLRLMACGEHPQAADSVGINVYRRRYAGVAISGVLGGIGGLAYTIAVGSNFASSVYGYGFLALAVLIFGNWTPVRITLAALFFAFFKVAGTVAGSGTIPFLALPIKQASQLYNILPYLVTIILLIFTSKRSRAPKAEGIPYDKGSR